MLNDSIWNDARRQSPKMRKYSADATTFKRNPRDLQRVRRQELDDQFSSTMRHVVATKREASERHNARRLERLIIQFKSNQNLKQETKNQLSVIETQDPNLFEELAMKKKWLNVSKDPVKGLKDQHMNVNAYWQMLNHLPPKGVNKIVTDRILEYDKSSCDRILQNILMEKIAEEQKKTRQ